MPIHKSKGKTTGLGICSYFALLFKMNEISPTRLTDEQIAKQVKKEFPGRETADRYLGKKKVRTVNEYRQRYNNGVFTEGKIPHRYSFRYNKEGNHIDRIGRRLRNVDVNRLKREHIERRKRK